MKQTIITILSVVSIFMMGCAKETKEISEKYELPEGLKDCKVYYLQAGGLGTFLNVVRCPNSQTTTTFTAGKATHSVTLVEDPSEKAKAEEKLREINAKESALKKLTPEDRKALGI